MAGCVTRSPAVRLSEKKSPESSTTLKRQVLVDDHSQRAFDLALRYRQFILQEAMACQHLLGPGMGSGTGLCQQHLVLVALTVFGLLAALLAVRPSLGNWGAAGVSLYESRAPHRG